MLLRYQVVGTMIMSRGKKMVSPQRCMSSLSFDNLQHIPTRFQEHTEFLNLAKTHGEGGISLTQRGKVVELLFLNNKKRNAMSGKMMFQLAHAIDHIHHMIEHDHELTCLAIRGEGSDVFCSGADLDFAAQVINTADKGLLMSHFMTTALNSLRQSPLISVCCLNGTAVGGGAEMSTVGDFRIMAKQDKRFIQFIHATIAASPGWGGAKRLTSIVGRREAIKLAASSRKISATEAVSIGLVDAVVEVQSESDWPQVIDNFLQPYLQQKFPRSVRAIKHAIAGVEHLSSSDAIALEQKVFHDRWYSSEHAAVMEKVVKK